MAQDKPGELPAGTPPLVPLVGPGSYRETPEGAARAAEAKLAAASDRIADMADAGDFSANKEVADAVAYFDRGDLDPKGTVIEVSGQNITLGAGVERAKNGFEIAERNREIERAVAFALSGIIDDKNLRYEKVFRNVYLGISIPPKYLVRGTTISIDPNTLALEVRTPGKGGAPNLYYRPREKPDKFGAQLANVTEYLKQQNTGTRVSLDLHRTGGPKNPFPELVELTKIGDDALTLLNDAHKGTNGEIAEGELLKALIIASGWEPSWEKFKQDYLAAKGKKRGGIPEEYAKYNGLRNGDDIQAFQTDWCKANINPQFDLYAEAATLKRAKGATTIHEVASNKKKDVDYYLNGFGHEVAVQLGLRRIPDAASIQLLYAIDPTPPAGWGKKGDTVIFNPNDNTISFKSKEGAVLAEHTLEGATHLADLRRNDAAPTQQPPATPPTARESYAKAPARTPVLPRKKQPPSASPPFASL